MEKSEIKNYDILYDYKARLNKEVHAYETFQGTKEQLSDKIRSLKRNGAINIEYFEY